MSSLSYARRLRRAAALSIGLGAGLAGAAAMALVVGLPLQPPSIERPTAVSTETSAPASNSTRNGTQAAADAAAKKTTAVALHDSAQKAATPAVENTAIRSRGTDASAPALPQTPRAAAPGGTTGAAQSSGAQAALSDDSTVTTPPVSAAIPAGRTTQKKHANKRKPHKTQFARAANDFEDYGQVRQAMPMQSERRGANARAGQPSSFAWPFQIR